MKKMDFCIIVWVIIIVAVGFLTIKTHLTTQTQIEKVEYLQTGINLIELRLSTLTTQVSYQKAFLDKTIATAITEKLMVEYDDAKEIKSFRNSIPLQDLLSLIIKRLDLKIVEVPARDGGYELKPVVEVAGTLKKKDLK